MAPEPRWYRGSGVCDAFRCGCRRSGPSGRDGDHATVAGFGICSPVSSLIDFRLSSLLKRTVQDFTNGCS